MSQSLQIDRVPTDDELETLFVNNEKLDQVEAYINRFNPIKTMKMERMEIRHSSILAWLLDPNETHGLGDRFLKSFLGEALRGHSDLGHPTALSISQCNLRDAEIRLEWKNIDIFILSKSNRWAFIVENKFYSTQSKGQLRTYAEKVTDILKEQEENLDVRGIFLTLLDEKPQDKSYVPIKYEAICEMIEHLMKQNAHLLSREVTTFMAHYLDIIKDETGMSDELARIENIARQLYRDHKKVLDFVIEHGASTEFMRATHSLTGENPNNLDEFTVGNQKIVYSGIRKDTVFFMPYLWYQAFDKDKYNWPGCENFGAQYPLIAWLQLNNGNDGVKGQLRLQAEIGPLSDHEFRKSLIESIQTAAQTESLSRVGFQKGAGNEGAKFSRFFKENTIGIKDIHNSDEIAKTMKKLLDKFQPEFEAVANVLPQFSKYGV
jgi:hypothetical protein